MNKIKLIYTMLLFSIAAFFLMCSSASTSNEGKKAPVKKLKGVSFVGGPDRVDLISFIDLKNTNVNAVSLMPFAFSVNGSGDLIWGGGGQWWGETPEGIQVCIDLAKEKGIVAMIKPQIWLQGGVFVGYLDHANDSLWKSFEEDYSRFILEFAALSEENRLPLFCIGTEVDQWVRKRPEYWRGLIKAIRSVYHGDLVYACNWGSEKTLPIWNDLNYIGVDMYGPVSHEATPSMDTLNASWKKYKAHFKQVSDSLKKEIIFTEWGYRSDDYCGRNPWADTLHGNVNYEAQANCYRALIENCYNEDWFMGGFVWKWFPTIEQSKAEQDHFTPQQKEAAKVMRELW
jgi:hypothetical protein